MKKIDNRLISLKNIEPHPQNREFPTIGEEWLAFALDVQENGILEPLTVREMEDDSIQCLKGHRRRRAGLDGGIEAAMCVVVECTDEEAFEEMYLDNMKRLNADPVDEANFVRGMVDIYGHTVDEVAAKLKRSIEWVRTRQRLLDLGDEVCEAVRRPGNDRLTMGAVEEILRVPEPLWPEAVQLVLHPELELGTLNETQARDVLMRCLVEPKARAAAWEKLKGKLQKAWREELEEICRPGTADELAVQVRSLEDAEKLRCGYEDAREKVPMELLRPEAPEGLRWVHLAVKHGLAVQVVPETRDARQETRAKKQEMESRPVVDGVLLREAENAAAEHGGEVWLITKKTGSVAKDDKVERAKLVAEGEGDPLYQDDGEEKETVIEQTMQHAAMIDMALVRKLALWAVSADADPNTAPEWVPQWAKELAYEGRWSTIDMVVNWVKGLKK